MTVPDLDRALQTIAQSLTFLKRERCRDVGGPVDLAPMIHGIFEDGSHDVAVLLADREAIPSLLWSMQNDHGPLAYVAFLTDAYHREVPVPRDASDEQLMALMHGRGETAAAFEAGDMSVTEMLVVLLLDVRTNRLHEVQTPYTLRDDGQPRFGKVRRHDEPDTVNLGRVAELLRIGAGLAVDAPPASVIDKARRAFFGEGDSR